MNWVILTPVFLFSCGVLETEIRLGISVDQSSHGLSLSQLKYALDILLERGILDCGSKGQTSTPALV